MKVENLQIMKFLQEILQLAFLYFCYCISRTQLTEGVFFTFLLKTVTENNLKNVNTVEIRSFVLRIYLTVPIAACKNPYTFTVIYV
jgi:hypothetical protein